MPHDAEHCVACRTQLAAPGRTRCGPCAAKRRRQEAEQREERREAGACVTCGKRAARGRSLCTKHLAYYAERTAAAKAAR